MSCVDDKQKERFADRLKHARLSRGFTQNDFADVLKCKQQEISRYEKGKCYPNEATIKSLAEALKVDTVWLSGKMSNDYDYSYEESEDISNFKVISKNIETKGENNNYRETKKQIKNVINNLDNIDLPINKLMLLKNCVEILAGDSCMHDLHRETQITFKTWGDLLD